MAYWTSLRFSKAQVWDAPALLDLQVGGLLVTLPPPQDGVLHLSYDTTRTEKTGAQQPLAYTTKTGKFDPFIFGHTVLLLVGGLDHVNLFADITAAQLEFTRNGNNLELSILGNAADRLTINGWYTSNSHQIEEFRLTDGSAVLAGQVNSLVSAMASFGGSASTALAGPTTGVMLLRPGVDLAMPWAA